jgi:hypothetical protein
MELRPPASEALVAAVEQELGQRLPPDYVEFLLVHNGGEGAIGNEGWARFIPVEDLGEENAACAEHEHLSGWLLFGTNGAGEAFLFNARGEVFVAPWIGDREDAIPQGRFAEFLRRLADGAMFYRSRG